MSDLKASLLNPIVVLTSGDGLDVCADPEIWGKGNRTEVGSVDVTVSVCPEGLEVHLACRVCGAPYHRIEDLRRKYGEDPGTMSEPFLASVASMIQRLEGERGATDFIEAHHACDRTMQEDDPRAAVDMDLVMQATTYALSWIRSGDLHPPMLYMRTDDGGVYLAPLPHKETGKARTLQIMAMQSQIRDHFRLKGQRVTAAMAVSEIWLTPAEEDRSEAIAIALSSTTIECAWIYPISRDLGTMDLGPGTLLTEGIIPAPATSLMVGGMSAWVDGELPRGARLAREQTLEELLAERARNLAGGVLN